MRRSSDDIRHLLESDRIWSAYALADLDPRYISASSWYVNENAAILIYAGFDPAVLFSMGPDAALGELLPLIPAGQYTYTLLKNSRRLIDPFLNVGHEKIMVRMVLDSGPLPIIYRDDFIQLTEINLGDVQRLFGSYPDQPDSFVASQLRDGIFFGYYKADDLVSIAGTHVLSKTASVAAIGNVFTKPRYRNRGLATEASICVVESLREMGIETIVLNVAVDNKPAQVIYAKIGFRHFCEYYEGQGELKIEAIENIGALNDKAV
ncbi:MAG: GNAT family N-acetyltransferase [Chloroflexi bacterium]|nr:GNAT family N-acetyltransferase [Chloroflexota bacterium]